MRGMMVFAAALAAAAACGQVETAPVEVQALKSYVWVKESAAKSDPLLKEVAAFFEKNDHFYLATVDGEGARVRPIRNTLIVDNKLVFATTPKKEMYKQLLKNPGVELSRHATDGASFVRFKGKAVLCEDAEVRAKFVELQPDMVKKLGDGLTLFCVEPEMVGIFSMKGEKPKTKSF